MATVYPTDCLKAVPHQDPKGISLSPIEEIFQSHEDIVSLFSSEMDSVIGTKSLTTPQSPSAMFSAGDFGEPRPPETESDTHNPDADHLLLDMLISELNTKEVVPGTQEALPLVSNKETSPSSSEAPSPLNPLECMNMTGNCDPLDNPFMTNDFDISQVLNSVQSTCDPNLSTTCSPDASPLFSNAQPVEDTIGNIQQLDLSECLNLVTHFEASPETSLIDIFSTFTTPVSSELSSESEPTTPLSATPSPPQVDGVSVENTRKRLASVIEAEAPPVKTSKLDKHTIRRIKNNEASRVSRAKRRERHNNVFSRVEELETENAQLKVQVEEMEAETARLKKLLVERLSK